MAKEGTVIVIKPNKITGTVNDPVTGKTYNFIDAEIPIKGIAAGDTVSYELVVIANIELATGLTRINVPVG